jgi:hypothetical protein
MKTFISEDRLVVEKDGSITINVEPIPFAGLVNIDEPIYEVKIIDPDDLPK